MSSGRLLGAVISTSAKGVVFGSDPQAVAITFVSTGRVCPSGRISPDNEKVKERFGAALT